MKESAKAYYHRDNCRFCKGKDLVKVIDLGNQPLAGGFLDKNQFAQEQNFPLCLYFCRDCTLLQNLEIIDKDILFRNYFYISSASRTGVEHFTSYAQEIHNRCAQKNKKCFIVEIGSNDGVLLLPLKSLGHTVLGVEPSVNVSELARKKGLEVITDFFTQKVAKDILQNHGNADVITANNVLAHIDDLDEVILGMKHLLKPEGILVFEVHYLYDLIEKLQYDTIYHEHFCYDSITSLQNYFAQSGMEIFDVVQIPMHAGSIRVFVKKKENTVFKKSPAVEKLIEKEKKYGLDKEKIYIKCAQRIREHKEKLLSTLNTIKKEGQRIVGYGAAGRANTLLNYCNISTDIIEYIVDESPLRQGKHTPGAHIPIFPVEKFRKDNHDYTLLLAWSYKKEILEKEKAYRERGGKFIIPLPEVSVL